MNSPIASILLVDPNDQSNNAVCKYLEGLGYQVMACSHYTQAIESISNFTFDLIVSELDIGSHTGFNLLAYINDHDKPIPLIFFTAGGNVRDVVEALRKGAADYVLKPLDDLSVLHKVAQKALSLARLQVEHAQNEKALRHANKVLNQSLLELERDQTAGRAVQAKLSPTSPQKFADITISYKIYPSLFLSGDAIDFGFLGDRYLAFYLTDIAGHGSASAVVAVWVKQLVRSLFRDQQLYQTRESFERDAPLMMQTINQALIKANLGTHLTCFVGVIDTQTLDMNYVVAGHLPLPILRTGKQTTMLEGSGKPLGLFDGAQWQLHSIALPEDFSLVAFSDGVLELMPGQGLIENEASLLKKMESFSSYTLNNIEVGLELEKCETAPDDVAMLLITGKLNE